MLQTVLFPKNKYTVQSAIRWLINHKYTSQKVDITGNFYRFRQRTPISYGAYYTVKLPNGIELVYEKNIA